MISTNTIPSYIRKPKKSNKPSSVRFNINNIVGRKKGSIDMFPKHVELYQSIHKDPDFSSEIVSTNPTDINNTNSKIKPHYSVFFSHSDSSDDDSDADDKKNNAP